VSARTVLLTGASGFVGRHLARALHAAGWSVRVALRDPARVADLPVTAVQIGDLRSTVDWTEALIGVTHVVHAAGLAHAGPGLPETAYTDVNVTATLALAQAARDANVQRFVYLSSIKAQVGAAHTAPVTDADLPSPDDAYGRSKLAAERGLLGLEMKFVALRPVLIYGPGVKANMAALIKLARLPLPLPFGAMTAQRSLLSVDNLASAVQFALTGSCPFRRAYIVSDPGAVTLGEMIAALRAGMGRKPGLFPVPPALLTGLAGLLGQSDRAEKLLGGLVAPPRDLMAAGWAPLVATRAGLMQLGANPTGL
jgi:nucleoside-diphosphate-sugar epimerase